jgi:cysteine sulfinate desulfinase/cysteine desulfurase-like protein
VSGGSACNTGVQLPSHVLVSIGVPLDFVNGSLRITLGHTNTLDEVREVLCPALQQMLRECTSQAPPPPLASRPTTILSGTDRKGMWDDGSLR